MALNNNHEFAWELGERAKQHAAEVATDHDHCPSFAECCDFHMFSYPAVEVECGNMCFGMEQFSIIVSGHAFDLDAMTKGARSDINRIMRESCTVG